MKSMVEFRMDNGCVAESNDPLRAFGKFPKVQLIHYPHTDRATRRTHNVMDCGIVQHLLHICEPFGIRSAKNKTQFSHGLA